MQPTPPRPPPPPPWMCRLRGRPHQSMGTGWRIIELEVVAPHLDVGPKDRPEVEEINVKAEDVKGPEEILRGEDAIAIPTRMRDTFMSVAWRSRQDESLDQFHSCLQIGAFFKLGKIKPFWTKVLQSWPQNKHMSRTCKPAGRQVCHFRALFKVTSTLETYWENRRISSLNLKFFVILVYASALYEIKTQILPWVISGIDTYA